MLPRLPWFLLGLLTLVINSVALPAPSQLPASSPLFRYEGRFDRTDPGLAVAIWSGSRISVDFSGTKLALFFGPIVDQCVFNVTVDGATEIADLHTAPSALYTWPGQLGAGRHHLEIFKRSEAAKGHAAFAGIGLTPGSPAWAPPAPAYRLKMEFFGDSITAGACNEDGEKDQWTDFRPHNFAKSWAHLTAQDLQADDRAMAYSGMGVITGWETVKAGEIWDKVYPRPDSVRADLKAWTPDVVFVNLGENDDSFTAAKQKPFPPDFAAGYVNLVRAIRGAYPHAQIVLLRGGMNGGAKSERLRGAWEAAVHELETSDAHIAHFVFTHYSALHPRVSDDRIMAGELSAWLKTQAFMAPHL